MKIRTLLSIALIVVFQLGHLLAEPVNMDDAAKVARNFIYEKLNQYHVETDYQDITIVESWSVDDAYYVFNLEDGWIIVSSRSERWPVIGYNFAGHFSKPDAINYNAASWMHTFVEEADFIINNNIEATTDINQQWDYYLTDDISHFSLEPKRDVATPLLTNLWNQDHPYNIFCPVDPNGPGGHVYVGCVATAMAMIMHYWRYPLQGQGEHHYYSGQYGLQYANFGETFYNYNGMRDVIENTNPFDVALISYHAAVSVNMSFSPEGSGAYSHQVPGAMITRFKYANSAQYLQKNNYPNSSWEAMMQEQLDLGRPLYYSGYSTDGGGHAFVCDGYQGSNYYHFNFGWGGSNNGWFNLQNVGGFPSGQGMVRNLIPNDPEYPYIAEGETILYERSGSFSDGSGPVMDYPEGMNASWLISPQSDTDTVHTINISFRKFNTASGDYLRIYNGNSTEGTLVVELSGSDLPEQVTISGDEAFVTFNSSSSASGFVAEYVSLAPTWCSGNTFITEPSGIISDGSGPYHYNNSTTCLRIIQVPDATEYILNFTKFATEEGKDILRIINGSNQTIASYSGHEIPDPLQITSSLVALAWSSNAVIRDEGWEVFYETDAVGIAEKSLNSEIELFPNPVTDVLFVNLMIPNINDAEVMIHSLEGQLIYHNQFKFEDNRASFSIPAHTISKGVYVFGVQTDQGLITRKIVVQ